MMEEVMFYRDSNNASCEVLNNFEYEILDEYNDAIMISYDEKRFYLKKNEPNRA